MKELLDFRHILTIRKRSLLHLAVCCVIAIALGFLSVLVSRKYPETWITGSFWILCLLAPVCEELIFRWLIYRIVKSFLGEWPAILLSAAFFAVAHQTLPQILFAFPVGILFTVANRKQEGIIIPILMHCLLNTSVWFFN